MVFAHAFLLHSLIFRTVLFNKDVVNVFLNTDMTLSRAVIHFVIVIVCVCVCALCCTQV